MDRLFLDANVLFPAACKPDARVLRLWTLRNVALFTSCYALEEARFNLEDSKQKRSLEKLSRELQFVEAPEDQKLPRGVTLPDKDAPILLAAIEAKADYLLTGDIRHFGPYLGKNIAGVTVILPCRYLKSRIRND